MFLDGTVTGDNYFKTHHDVVAPQPRSKANFDELYFLQDGEPLHYARTQGNIYIKPFRSVGFEGGAVLNDHHVHLTPDLTSMDLFCGVVKNKVYMIEIPTQ